MRILFALACYRRHVQDVTAQRRAEAMLRDSEERLRTIFEAAPIGVALVDARAPWPILQANRALCQMLGLDPDRVVGRAEP